MRAPLDAERHDDVEERRVVLDETGARAVVELDRDRVAREVLELLHHVLGVEHRLERLAVVLDGDGVRRFV